MAPTTGNNFGKGEGALFHGSNTSYDGLHGMSTGQQQLSGPAVFWALSTVALNTMSQPSGRILGYPSSWNFALRCSPVVCAASTIYTFIRLIVQSVRNTSVKKALQDFANYRFGDEEDVDGEGSFTSLRKNTVFRIGLFVFGALPAITKLCASKGIPYSQSWSTMYFACFLLDETLLAVAPRPNHVPPTNDNAGQYFGSLLKPVMRVIRTCLVLGFYGYANALFKPFGVASQDISLLWLTEIWFIYPSLGLLLWVILIKTTIAYTLLAPWLTAGGFMFSAILGTSMDRHLGSVEMSWLRPTMQIAWSTIVLLALGYLSSLTEPEIYTATPKDATRISFALGSYYLYLHVGIAILYYGFDYDLSTTSRPPWTEWLG